MCVKAGPPLTSTIAQMPGTSVSSREFTLMNPSLSVSTPAAPRFKRSEFGTRPSARSRWLPGILLVPSPVSSTARTPALVFSRSVTCVELRISMPSSFRIFSTSAETSGSSRRISRGSRLTMVTRAPNLRNRGPAAGVDDDALAFQLARSAAFEFHNDAPRVLESGLAEDEFEVGGFLERLLAGIAEALDHAALAIDHPAHVHRDAAGVDAVVFCAPGEIRNPTARDHRFGRGAADVDASAADVLALDHRDLPAGAGERERKRLARLASTDDYCVVCGIAHAASGENGKGSRGPAALARAN